MVINNQERVEDAWRETLVMTGGLDPDTAERITTAIQSHLATAYGGASDTELAEIISDQIKELDLEAYETENPEDVRDELLDLLEQSMDTSPSSMYRQPVAMAGGRGPAEWSNHAGADADESDTASQDETVISGSVEPRDDGAEFATDPEAVAGFRAMTTDSASPENTTGDPSAEEGESFASSAARSPDGESEQASPEQPTTEQTNQGGSEGESESEGEQAQGSSQPEIDLPEYIARLAWHHSESGLADDLPVATREVRDPVVAYGNMVARLYAAVLQDVLFEGYSDAEQEILFNQLIKQRMEEQLGKSQE